MTEPSKTVDQALTLLEALGSGGAGSAAQLARRVDLNRTVAHRLLVTLERHGFVRRRDGMWDLGLGLAALGQKVERDVRHAAGPALEALAHDLGETAILAVPDGTMAVAIEQVVATAQPVQVRYRPGFRHPLSRAAHGLAILAFSPPEVVDEAVADLDDAARLRERLAQVRHDGYATTRNELEFGASGLAAPVFAGAPGPVCASLGIVAPVDRFPETPHAIGATVRAARAVSERLTAPVATLASGPREIGSPA